LAKVIEAITSSMDQVFGTMILGFFVQYMFVAVSFMIFGVGYGFADKDTSGCATLLECLRDHFDYGFRSAPVWEDGPALTTTRFLFDYLYNLIIILIMAAIISGIIIDTFAELRETQQEIQDAMRSQCFICSLPKSDLERHGVKFEKHILRDHYMWAYARFLLYLEEIDQSTLTGPETHVKQRIKENDVGFFPIERCIQCESEDIGEEHLERVVRVKDMDEFKENVGNMATNTEDIKRSETIFKLELKDLREAIIASTIRVAELQKLVVQDDDQDRKKKKKKGA